MVKRLISLFVMCVMSFFLPQTAGTGTNGLQFIYRELVTTVAPAFSYSEEEIAKGEQLVAGAEFENKKAAGQIVTEESAETADETEKQTQTDESNLQIQADETQVGETEEASTENFHIIMPENVNPLKNEKADDTDGTEVAEEAEVIDRVLLEKLSDFDYLIQNYYIVDSSTTICSDDISAGELLAEDLTVSEDADGPQILIYHTHSQECYADSVEGDASTSVVALGEYLTKLLTEKYGFSVLHHTGEYDVDDRDHAYSNAAPAIERILEENPSIEVVIDLHRDSVPEDNHLVTKINGKDTAKLMFFNGLCRTTASGNLTKLSNPYLQDNLAFSLQMQIAAAQKYPGLTRKIYLKGYRYNMHFCPKSLLVEVGAQNNTFEEGMNAMEPLAELLAEVLR